jgi:predicted nuclease of predicted toxin-antitoxin system
VTTTRSQRAKPRVRLLWDEQLSSLVPKALRVLEFRVTHVGADDPGVPPKGSTDAAVVEYAQKANQIIVTTNHDMMTLCAEVGQRFVWLDPRGRQLSRQTQVLLVFQQIDQWERLLGDDVGACVVAMRTRCQPISAVDAARRARNRMRRIERRKRTKRRLDKTDRAAPRLEDE